MVGLKSLFYELDVAVFVCFSFLYWCNLDVCLTYYGKHLEKHLVWLKKVNRLSVIILIVSVFHSEEMLVQVECKGNPKWIRIPVKNDCFDFCKFIKEGDVKVFTFRVILSSYESVIHFEINESYPYKNI